MAGHGGVDAALDLLADWVSWRIALSALPDLRQGRQAQSARARAIVGRLAVAHALCSAAFVARHFGKANATLCEQMAASRVRDADNHLVTLPMLRILEEIARHQAMPAGTARAAMITGPAGSLR
jgi:hypothetical protein